LLKALNDGLLPRHYLIQNPKKRIESYLGAYLKDEIIAEAKIRNIAVFSKFLESAAFSNGEILNYTNIASDCGVSAVTIKEYFQILEDTMIGRVLPAFTRKAKRRIISAPKFYFFDIGVVNYLLHRGKIEYKSENFGHAFEHFIYLELYAHSKYSELNYEISYWRTSTQFEVDFILGNHRVAIEVKSSESISTKHLKGLKQFSQEYETERLIAVSQDIYYRKIENIEIMPWEHFLTELWSNKIIY
jgi:predicted AAA+ superfamily ATPase